MAAAEAAPRVAAAHLLLIGWRCRGLERLGAALRLAARDEGAARLEQDPAARALLVYQAPWRCLAEALAPSPEAASPESAARRLMGQWHSYHLALARLQRAHAGRTLLVNADHADDLDALAEALRGKLGVVVGLAYAPAEAGRRAARHDEVLRHVVGTLSPPSLELYAGLESRAELMGRAPELERAAGGAFVPDVVRLLAARVAAEAEHAAAEAQIERVQGENALHLLQLEQMQAELERYVELEGAQARRLEELERRLAEASAPLARRLARRIGSLFTGTAGKLGRDERALRKQVALLRGSGLFDEKWYLEAYADVAQGGSDPIEHYLRYGAAEGRNPSAAFDTRHYLSEYPDVVAGGINPLVHYVQFGRSEGREPQPDDA